MDTSQNQNNTALPTENPSGQVPQEGATVLAKEDKKSALKEKLAMIKGKFSSGKFGKPKIAIPKKFIVLAVVLVILLLVLLVVMSIFTNNTKKPSVSATPSSTPSSTPEAAMPSQYADDPEILEINQAIDELVRDLNESSFREEVLSIPSLDWNVAF